MMTDVAEVKVVVAHNERATLHDAPLPPGTAPTSTSTSSVHGGRCDA
jgi:hypothetical protein